MYADAIDKIKLRGYKTDRSTTQYADHIVQCYTNGIVLLPFHMNTFPVCHYYNKKEVEKPQFYAYLRHLATLEAHFALSFGSQLHKEESVA